MAKWSEIFSKRDLIANEWFFTEGVFALEAPEKAAIVRVSMVGAGGWKQGGANVVNPGTGAGAAFARYKGSCTPGEDFTVQVGDAQKTKESFNVNGDANGDSIFTRVTGAVVLCKADRGRAAVAGSEANSIGTVKRAGTLDGASGGDDEDTISLGFGGVRGKTSEVSSNPIFAAAGPGGGGVEQYAVYHGVEGGGGYYVQGAAKAGSGLVCVQFFRADPGH